MTNPPERREENVGRPPLTWLDHAKNLAVVLGLVGGLMSMGTIVGGFVQVVRYWDQFVYMSKVVNRNDVRYYHETLKPRVEELWQEKNHR